MTEPIWTTGGAGGERAVVEDLLWAVGALRVAAADAESARLEIARRAAQLELSPSVGQAGLASSLGHLSYAHARPIIDQLEDTARRLRAVAGAYLAAERRARQQLGVFEIAEEAVADHVGKVVWATEAAGAALAVGALALPGSAPLAVASHGRLVSRLLPHDAPPTTGTLTRDVVERALGFDQYLGVVALLDAVMRGLEGWLREPESFAVSAAHVEAAPVASLEEVMRRLRETELAGGGAVRIERWTDAEGVVRRIVYIPGTEDWGAWDANAADIEADLALELGKLPDLADDVAAALVADGADPGEPILLAGHSLGGILATALAGNRDFVTRFDVRAVVTAGSPVGRLSLPRRVNALHLEGTRDIVPGLDGMPNPDTATRVTVHHDARRSEEPQLHGAARGIGSAHSLDTYAVTARLVDQGLSPSAEAWRSAERGFFEGPKSAVVTEYRGVTRP